ncbi:MAG TPA: site-specific integrase [Dehalococcoidia bacterium]|nr:site-specific integrase [Dehalococcoidia bacterium]
MMVASEQPKPRRPRGEGSIKRVGDRWLVRLRAGGRDERRWFATQGEALDELDRLRRKAALGTRGRYTVADCIDDFLAQAEARQWSPSTVATYTDVLRLHIKPALGKRQLAELRVHDVQRVLDRMREHGLSARYVSHTRSVFRAAVNHAMRAEHVHRNVAALTSAPAGRQAETHVLSREEMGRLFAALEGERLRTMIMVMATLALRRGEAVALRWEDLALDDGLLTVRRTAKRVGREHYEGEPKTARSRRTLALPPFLVAALRAQRAAVVAEQLRLGPAWRDEGYVFPGEDGGPCSANAIRLALSRGLKRAGIEKHVRIHDLRHSAISALLAGGGSLQDAQALAGHTSISLTADLYAHFMPDQRAATAARIEAYLGSAVNP